MKSITGRPAAWELRRRWLDAVWLRPLPSRLGGGAQRRPPSPHRVCVAIPPNEGDPMPIRPQPLEVLVAWLDAMRRQDLEALSDCYAPDVVWRGVVPEALCHDRREVLDLLAEQLADGLPQVQALEMIAGDHAVVLGFRSPDLTEVAGIALRGQIFNVFTVADGRIVAVQDHTDRAAALRDAGAADPAWS